MVFAGEAIRVRWAVLKGALETTDIAMFGPLMPLQIVVAPERSTMIAARVRAHQRLAMDIADVHIQSSFTPERSGIPKSGPAAGLLASKVHCLGSLFM